MKYDDLLNLIKEAESCNIQAGHAQPHIKDIALKMLDALKSMPEDVKPFAYEIKRQVNNETDSMQLWREIQNMKGVTVYVVKTKEETSNDTTND